MVARPRRLEAMVERLRALLSDVGAARTVLPRAVRRARLRSGERRRALADLQRLPFLTKALIRATPSAQGRRCARPRRYNTGGSSRRAAGLLHRQGAGQPRRRRQVARHALVGRGHRRPRNRGLGLADRARRAGPAAAHARRLLRTAAARIRDVRGKARRVRRRDPARPPAMLFGYPSALAHIARHAEKRGSAMDDLGIRVAFVTRSGSTTTSARRSRTCSAAGSPTATAAATPVSSRTSARRAACT